MQAITIPSRERLQEIEQKLLELKTERKDLLKRILEGSLQDMIGTVSKLLQKAAGQKIAVFIRGTYQEKYSHSFLGGWKTIPSTFAHYYMGIIDPSATELIRNQSQGYKNTDYLIPMRVLIQQKNSAIFAPAEDSAKVYLAGYLGDISWKIYDLLLPQLPPEIQKALKEECGVESKCTIQLNIGDSEFAAFLESFGKEGRKNVEQLFNTELERQQATAAELELVPGSA
jgi:hypothetical protein